MAEIVDLGGIAKAAVVLEMLELRMDLMRADLVLWPVGIEEERGH